MILSTYLEAGNRERLYGEAPHLLESDTYSDAMAGAWMLGNDIRSWLSDTSTEDASSMQQALQLLAQEIDVDGTGRLGRDMRPHAVQSGFNLLMAMHAGLSASTDA